jgi:hypothetical protein
MLVVLLDGKRGEIDFKFYSLGLSDCVDGHASRNSIGDGDVDLIREEEEIEECVEYNDEFPH